MCPLFLALLLQATPLPGRPIPSTFSPVEARRLEREPKVEERMKIYRAASEERHRSILMAMAEQNTGAVSITLRSWTDLLDYSLEDIQKNAGQKSKSKALREYEIQLRKAFDSIDNIKLRGTTEQFDEFEEWLKHAQDVRAKLVRILFPT